jgi:hypothetical protein
MALNYDSVCIYCQTSHTVASKRHTVALGAGLPHAVSLPGAPQQRRCRAGMSAEANVWSAAVPQAKVKVAGWSAQMYTALVGEDSSGFALALTHFAHDECIENPKSNW